MNIYRFISAYTWPLICLVYVFVYRCFSLFCLKLILVIKQILFILYIQVCLHDSVLFSFTHYHRFFPPYRFYFFNRQSIIYILINLKGDSNPGDDYVLYERS